MAERCAVDRRPRGVQHGPPESDCRQRTSRADPDGGTHGHRISHRACASPDWSWAARRRREAGSAGRRRAGIRRVAALVRGARRRRGIHGETGQHTGHRGRCHAGRVRVSGQPPRLDSTAAPRVIRRARRRPDRRHRQAETWDHAGAGEGRAARARGTGCRGAAGDTRAPSAARGAAWTRTRRRLRTSWDSR